MHFLSTLFFLLPLGFASLAHAADDCAPLLTVEQLTLPRDLKISEGAAQYFLSEKSSSGFLQSISRVFTSLHSGHFDLVEIGIELAEGFPGQYDDLDLSQNDFFRDHPDLVSLQVKRNFFVLSHSLLARELCSNDLALLAYVWRNTPHNEPGQSVDLVLDRVKVAEQMRRHLARIQHLLSMPQYRQALIALIDDEEGRAHYQKLFRVAQSMSIRKTGYLQPDDLDQTARDLARGRVLKQDALLNINRFMDSFAIEISQYGNHGLGLQTAHIEGPVMTYYRDQFLIAMAPFFAEKFHLKSHLNSLSNLIDHLYFGSALPWTAQQLYQNVIDETKRLLLPLKSKYSAFQAESLAAKSARAEQPTGTPFQLNLVDLFAPGAGQHIRVRTESTALDATTDAKSIESTIAFEEALRPFTTFSQQKRDLAELVPGQVYKFWFLRESEPRLQKVRVSGSVCDWLKLHPDSATQLLNALHLGKARSVGQSGIKILNFLASSRYDGSIFELKTSNSLRGLLLNVQGTWEFVGVADKDELYRVVDTLVPIDN